MKINPPTAQFGWPTLNINPTEVTAWALHLDHVKYRLGAKAKTSEEPDDIMYIDCSGFVKYVLGKLGINIPDGSWAQGEWCKQQGFKESSVGSCGLKDGILRLVVLPQQPGRGVGRHVAFVLNGYTYESCGGKGVCSRVWNGQGWQGKTNVWVLAHPVRP